jgi:hypothetical protein
MDLSYPIILKCETRVGYKFLSRQILRFDFLSMRTNTTITREHQPHVSGNQGMI